jgi:hypothetical protein
VRAVDRKNLEGLAINISNPTGDIGRFPVRRTYNRISIGGKPSLTRRKLFETAERNPGVIASFPLVDNGREKVAHEGHAENHSDDTVQENSDLHEKTASGNAGWWSHRTSPVDLAVSE